MTIFGNPVAWVASTVATRFRFLLLVAVQSVLTLYVVHEASTEGLRSAAALTLFLVWNQFLLAYALRATYQRLAQQGRNEA